MLEIFDEDLFHMGGDEVNVDCWNATEEITDYLKKKNLELSRDNFIALWNTFQSKGNAPKAKLSRNLVETNFEFTNSCIMFSLKSTERSKQRTAREPKQTYWDIVDFRLSINRAPHGVR